MKDQSAKILIFDTKGNIVCEAKHALKPYNLPRPGIVEHPDDDWWDAICEAGKKCMAKFEGNKEDIVGIGLCTIRYCRAYLRPMARWLSQRSAGWISAWRTLTSIPTQM